MSLDKIAGNPCFFYGTLMSKSVLVRVIGHQMGSSLAVREGLVFERAVLKGYKRLRVKGQPYPAMVQGSASDVVKGIYVKGLTDSNLLRLDAYEGNCYTSESVAVTTLSADGRVHQSEEAAYTYVWAGPLELLDVAEWDFEDFVRNKQTAWLGNAAEFEEVDNFDESA